MSKERKSLNLRFLSLVAALSLLLAACGDDGSESGSDSGATEPTVLTDCPTGDQTEGTAPQTLTVDADPSGAPKFKQTTLTAEAGEISLVLDNPAPRCHDLAVKDEPGEVYGTTENKVKQGKTNVLLDLDPGKYYYYSTVPGESTSGMIGLLKVK